MNIHKTLYLMAIRDEDLLNEGLKAKVAAGAIIGGVALGMIPPPQQTQQTTPQTQQTPPQTQQTTPQTQQTPPQTQQTPPQTQQTPPQTPPQTTQKPTVKVPYDTVLEKTGFTQRDYDTFRTTLAKIESNGEYDIAGGSNKHYDGRYQLGAAAKTDGARTMGVPDPGHDTAGRQAFRSNADNQEQIFAGYTIANHNYLMKRSKGYASKTPQQQLQILGYAHNQGMGGAAKWIETGVVGSDGFGTKGTKYTDSLRAAYTLDNETVAAETAKAVKDAEAAKVKTTTSTIKKESYKDKIRMYLREEGKPPSWGPLPGMEPFDPRPSKLQKQPWSQLRTDSYKYNYGDVFGPKGILSPESATVKEPKLIPRLTTTSKYGLPIVQSNGHRIGVDGILSVKSHTNINRKHPKFGQIETHVYDGNTRIATFTSAFNRGAPGMTHTPTNNLFFESDSNSEQSTRRREMDDASEEFFNRELNKKTAEYDRDDKIRDVIDDHFNETMGGHRNMSISEFHRTYIEKEFPPPPSDGPGDGSSYGELT